MIYTDCAKLQKNDVFIYTVECFHLLPPSPQVNTIHLYSTESLISNIRLTLHMYYIDVQPAEAESMAELSGDKRGSDIMKAFRI